MKMKLLSFIIYLGILQSCISIQTKSLSETPGFYSGYKELPKTTQDSIIFTNTSLDISKIKNDGKIYSITGHQLIESLKKTDSVMVYFWSIYCSSKSCVPLNIIEQYCKNKNLDLFVITEYYHDFSQIRLQYRSLEKPLFSINEQFYKTQYCNKYIKLFRNDLLINQDVSSDDILNNYFVFNKGILTETMKVLPK